MRRRPTETILWFSLVLVLLAGIHLYTILYTPASREGSPRIVEIPRGASFRTIALNLKKAGIIRDIDSFTFAAGLIGAYKQLKAGEYELSPTMTVMEVLDILVKGRVKEYQITFPEGYTIKEMARILGEEGLVEPEEFIKRASDGSFAQTLGFDGPGLEGYLFPDTYRFTKGMSIDEIIIKMTDRFKEVYNTSVKERAQELGMSMKEVVTLASIIEKETGVAEERPLISAVFHNRLKRGLPLQSDPTVIYSLKDFDGNLKKDHLLIDTPYNTYIYPGLPPGPIANPGLAALEAALNPSKVDYLYFVSRNDGTHHFSTSLEEHNRAVNLYQKSLIKTQKISLN